MESAWCGHPGIALGEHDQGFEEVHPVLACGGQVASDRAELAGSDERAQASGHLLPQFDHADVAFGAVVVGGYPPVGGEAQIVVLPVDQPMRQRVVLFHQRAGAGRRLVDADQGGRAVAGDLVGQRVRVDGVPAGFDRLGHQLLHRHHRVGGLAGPAPRAGRRAVDDAVQLRQHVRTAKLVGDVRIGVVGRPRVVDGNPQNRPSTPRSSIPARPRRGWQLTRVYLPVRAQCTQCSLPSTRNPVSSKPTTSQPAISSRTRSTNSPSRPAARAVTPATVPADSGVPNSSANACAVRSLDRNCPTYRYTTTAASRGPYCTGASTPSGALPRTRCPHTHSRSTNRCSVTSTRSGGRSNSWRRSISVTGRPASERPQPAQQPGSCTTSWSGSATCISVVPSWPDCPPGLRPERRRNDRGAGFPNPSDEGGFDEFQEFCPSLASSSATRSTSPPASCPHSPRHRNALKPIPRRLLRRAIGHSRPSDSPSLVAAWRNLLNASLAKDARE